MRRTGRARVLDLHDRARNRGRGCTQALAGGAPQAPASRSRVRTRGENDRDSRNIAVAACAWQRPATAPSVSGADSERPTGMVPAVGHLARPGLAHATAQDPGSRARAGTPSSSSTQASPSSWSSRSVTCGRCMSDDLTGRERVVVAQQPSRGAAKPALGRARERHRRCARGPGEHSAEQPGDRHVRGLRGCRRERWVPCGCRRYLEAVRELACEGARLPLIPRLEIGRRDLDAGVLLPVLAVGEVAEQR
jgi:hypothetical protein